MLYKLRKLVMHILGGAAKKWTDTIYMQYSIIFAIIQSQGVKWRFDSLIVHFIVQIYIAENIILFKNFNFIAETHQFPW